MSRDSKTLKVDEETENTMRVTWKPAPGKVVNYRVMYRPQGGGRQMVAKVPPTVTSTVLKRLQPQTTYDITVLPIYKTGEGKIRQGSGTTGKNKKLKFLWEKLYNSLKDFNVCTSFVNV